MRHRVAIIERLPCLSTLSRVFAIEICSYAVISNHYHLVVRIDEEKGAAWSDEEVARCWKKLYSWPLLVQEYLIGFTIRDYLELVDWAGRAVRDHKGGSIPESVPSILDRLELDSDAFLEHISTSIEKQVHPKALGSIDKLKALAENLKQKFIRNQSYSLRLYKL